MNSYTTLFATVSLSYEQAEGAFPDEGVLAFHQRKSKGAQSLQLFYRAGKPLPSATVPNMSPDSFGYPNGNWLTSLRSLIRSAVGGAILHRLYASQCDAIVERHQLPV